MREIAEIKKENFRRGVLTNHKGRSWDKVVYLDGVDDYGRKREGQNILYLEKKVSREEYALLKHAGMKTVRATVMDPKHKGAMVNFFEEGV